MKVSIIGAGFSGLTLAYYLNKKGFDVEIFEKNSIPGGLIQTHHTSHGLVETAATSILHTPALSELLKDINLPLLKANKESSKRFILRNHIPKRFPLTFGGAFSLIKGLLRLSFARSKYIPKEKETLSNWADRIFSKEVRSYLISPAMQGIYAESSERLSANLVLKKLFDKNKRTKSSGPINFDQGMGQFITKLESYLTQNKVKVFYNSPVNKENLPDNPVVLATSMLHAHHLFDSIPVLPLKNITSATLFFDTQSPIVGFGILFPREENLNSNGVLFNNCMFKKRTTCTHSETWIMSDVHELPDQEILNKIKEDRLSAFSNNDRPISFKITTWSNAFPIYGTQLESLLKEDFKLPNNIFVTGNYLGSLGLSGILEQNRNLSISLLKDAQ